MKLSAFIVRQTHSRPRYPARTLPRWSVGAAAVGALALAIAGCGSSGKPSSSGSSPSTTQAAGHPGGTWTILANSAFGQADPAQNYTAEEWQLLIDTHDGLTGFAKVGGTAGTKIVLPAGSTRISSSRPRRRIQPLSSIERSSHA